MSARDLPTPERQPASDMIAVFGRGGRSDETVLVAEAVALKSGDAAFVTIARPNDEICGFAIRGRVAYAITTKGAPYGRLLRVDLGRGDAALANATTLLNGASDLILSVSAAFETSVVAAREGVYLQAFDGVSDRLLYFPVGAGAPQPVMLPFKASIARLKPTVDGDGAVLLLESVYAPPRAFRLRNGRLAATHIAGAGGVDLARYARRAEIAVSADGTRVPMSLIMRRGATSDGARPLIIFAYASYGATTVSPVFRPTAFAWADEGGVVAYCGARGGGEKGRAWHRDGQADSKPKAQADVVAGAHRLVELGWTTPKRTAFRTYSAGGLPAPAIFDASRPFAAAAFEVAYLNPTRGGRNYDEIGEDGDPTQLRWVGSQDGVLALDRTAQTPDIFVTRGFNDDRTQYWQALKFVATGERRFGRRARFLLNAGRNGHASGHLDALIYALFLNRFQAQGLCRLNAAPNVRSRRRRIDIDGARDPCPPQDHSRPAQEDVPGRFCETLQSVHERDPAYSPAPQAPRAPYEDSTQASRAR